MREWAAQFRALFRATQSKLEIAQENSAGQKLAIVGPPASGKTFIWTFLKSGGTTLITEHRPTIGADRVSAQSAVINTGEENSVDEQLTLMLADNIDVSGDFEAFAELWDRVISDAFLVVFIFDVSKFIGLDGNIAAAAQYRRLVLDASRFAGKRIQHSDTNVVLAIGWCDKLNDWSPSNSGPFFDQIYPFHSELTEVKNCLGVNTDKPARQVEGSLGNERWAQTFIYRIFSEGTRGKI
jgi:hypothetical protein